MSQRSTKVRKQTFKGRLLIFLFATTLVLIALFLLEEFGGQLQASLQPRMAQVADPYSLVKLLRLFLLALLAYLFVRAMKVLIFGLIFRLRRGSEAPTLVQNIFSLLAFLFLFLMIFN